MNNVKSYGLRSFIGVLLFAISLVFPLIAFAEEYNPQINPDDFSTNITNKYFSLPVGRKFVYEADTGDGKERIEILITDETKMVQGVKTLVYWDRVWLNDELIEDTRDYLAQDKQGNVWYFGEDVDNYEDGKLKDHSGSWLAGKDGAKAGIWMKADPKVGESYKQEYYVGEAEDMADVLSLTETITVPYGSYTNCLKTYDWSQIDPNAKEYKFYCPEVKGFVLETVPGSDERVELVSIEDDALDTEDSGSNDNKSLNSERWNAMFIALGSLVGIALVYAGYRFLKRNN